MLMKLAASSRHTTFALLGLIVATTVAARAGGQPPAEVRSPLGNGPFVFDSTSRGPSG